MVATVATDAYLGLEARAVEVQVQLSTGIPRFVIVGLPDKAVAESRERVRAALEGADGAAPDPDGAAGALWVFVLGSEANRSICCC